MTKILLKNIRLVLKNLKNMSLVTKTTSLAHPNGHLQ